VIVILRDDREGGYRLIGLGRRLDHALAGVALGGDTGDGIGILVLKVLVRSLLVFLGHGVGGSAGEGTDGGEDSQAGSDGSGDTPEDTGALTGGGASAGTVAAKDLIPRVLKLQYAKYHLTLQARWNNRLLRFEAEAYSYPSTTCGRYHRVLAHTGLIA